VACIHFDGVDDGVYRVPAAEWDGAVTDLSECTIFAQLKGAATGTQTAVRMGDHGSLPALTIGFAVSSGAWEAQIGLNDGTLRRFNSGVAPNGSWVTLAATYASGDLRGFKDGSQIGATLTDAVALYTADHKAVVGF
jgi:hypothetical protein